MDATTATTTTTPTTDSTATRTARGWRLTAARYVAGAGLGLLALVSGTAAMDAAAAGTGPATAAETVLVRTVDQSTPASSDPSMAASRSAWS